MARLRTSKKLLEHQPLPDSFLKWVFFLLEKIGQYTYKSIFLILKSLSRACYYAFYTLYYLLILIIKTFVFVLKIPFKILNYLKKTLIQLIKPIKLLKPKVAKPEIKPEKVIEPVEKVKPFKVIKPEKIKLPLIRFKFSKINFLFVFITTIGLSGSIYFYITILKDLPNPDKLTSREQVVSTKIYDRNGELLFTIFNGNQNRSLIKLNDIPDYVKEATIAIEDKDFYRHPGFSPRGIIRAVWRNVSNSELQGGSTITQQLIKNALLTPEKTWQRKIKEVILSVQVELIYSKDEILQMYLNEVAYGGTAYGVEEAAQTYFDKSIQEVNLAEAALLAGLPAAPTKYSPFGANPKMAAVRQRQVLEDMVSEGYITNQEAEEAKKQRVVLAPQKIDIKAPHFVMYVKDLLVEKYGTKMVEQGGLKVITSLDLNTQKITQKRVTEEINKLANMRVSNGAALVTNPKTGDVLAMVGSRDFFDLKNDGNVNVTTSLRQPGSAIKVINYAVALSNGFTPATIIPDTPITYKIPGAESYTPVNYDDRFHGNVTLRTALGSSYNVPAVKTLAVFGINKMINLGEKMGITSWQDRSRFGLSLTLGGGEVKMTDMAVTYSTLSNLGLRVDLKPILQITDYKGRVLNDFDNGQPKRAIDSNVAYLLTDILKDNQARTPAFGPSSFLIVPGHEVAVKTGTTNDKRDNWTIGYTEDMLVAVWVGNNDNTPMSAVASGVTGASPIWNYIISDLLKDKEAQQFTRPDDLIKVQICSLNGLLSCAGCPTKEEYFLPGTEPKYHCNSEEIKRILEEKKEKEEDKILEAASTER